jgi:tetratricopeptide (TPR) repeat protein
MTQLQQAISVFYSYAHEDEELRNQLNTHLKTLERLHLIVGWHDRDIRAGTEWEHEVNKHFSTAQIILLLISSDFIASDYEYSLMKRALERYESGEAHVIPILLRPCDVSETPFSFLQMLPTNGEAVTSSIWPDLDAAFFDVEQGIRRVVQDWQTKTAEQWWRDGYSDYKRKEYRKALAAFNRALRVDQRYVRALRHKGDVFFELNQNKDALEAYDEALRLDANAVRIHRNRGMILWRLGKYDEALVAYDEALRHDKNKSANLFNERGNVLYSLARYEEALTAYTHATRLDSLSSHAFRNV